MLISTYMKHTLIQITNNGMGSGDEELGLKLITNYLTLINEDEQLPQFITFYNSGVKVLCTGSPAAEILKVIEKKGVKLIACKTCLSYYKLMDKLEVGIMGSMIDIIGLHKLSNKIINL